MEPTEAEAAALRRFAPYCNRDGQCRVCTVFLNGFRGVEEPGETQDPTIRAAWRKGHDEHLRNLALARRG